MSRSIRGRALLFGVMVTVLLGSLPSTLSAQETFRLPTSGVKLPGPQLMYDAAFEVFDFNGDGKADLFMPNTSMMAFAFHPNEGTTGSGDPRRALERPRFGHALGYPVNLTETEPQPVEHTHAFAVCDLNGDGLFDLIVVEGALRYIANVGAKTGPNHWQLAKMPNFFPGSDKMLKENARFSTGPESLHWNKGIFGRQAVTLAVVDWDGDGLDDLLICRFKEEPPGVTATGGVEQWTGAGRWIVNKPTLPPPPPGAPKFLGKLDAAPARGLYFYKNIGTKQKPWFDVGTEIRTPDGKSIAAPNPVTADVDGDGALDLVATETEYACNAFRVDWPTAPAVQWFRRPKKDDTAVLEAARPLPDAAGKPIPAGTQVRFADVRGAGVKDLLVMDGGLKGALRWYANRAKGPSARSRIRENSDKAIRSLTTSATTTGPSAALALAPAEELRGRDFLRFDFMCQPLVVNWFGPNSRDLIVHGSTDAHCCWSLRRTALYRNVAKKPGEIEYEFAGQLNYQGDPRMVGPELEDRPYDVYGSTVCLWPDGGVGRPAPSARLLMSVSGKLYLFSELADDGLTFRKRTPLDLPAERNRRRGWQEIDVKLPEKVRYLRVTNDRNGMGNMRDAMLHIVRFEALAGGKNWATLAEGVSVTDFNKEPSVHYRVQRPTLMFTPGNEPSDTEPKFTSFGYYIGGAVITLREPVQLDKIRFLLSDREERWYHFRLPYYWQGQHFRAGIEQGEPWYQYTVEASADGQKWTMVSDTMPTEMMRSTPNLVDWDGDGKVDLVLGVLNGKGIWPGSKEYRLYRNTGSNEQPHFREHEQLCDEAGKPFKLDANYYLAYGLQCGIAVRDMDGDGKLDLVTEGLHSGELSYYRNVTSDPAKGQRFQKPKSLGSPYAIRYNAGYRYFYLGDVDGDGIPDLLNSANASIAFFKGVRAAVPPRAENLRVAASDAKGIELRWPTLKGAVRYDVRWAEKPVTELEWWRLPGWTGNCDVKGTEQGAFLPVVAKGKTIHLAIKSANEAGEWSELSENVQAVAAPWRQIVLRNGPAAGDIVPAYQGNQACYVDADKPGEVTPRKPSALKVRAQTPRGPQQQVILLRFADLPALDRLEHASLELSTDPSLQLDPNDQLGMATLAVSCHAVRLDWDPDKVTFAAKAPGRPWEKNELDAGGRFQSFAQPSFTVGRRHTLRWDVTDELRTARKEGTNVHLLLRVDYTGPYVAGHGYAFCGSDFPAVEQRPRLRLTFR